MGRGRLEGKVAIITGASDGIGRATAMLFAEEGSKLALADINQEGLKEAENIITKSGGTAISRITDVSKESDVEALIRDTAQHFGRIDILCNNAGYGGQKRFVAEVQEGEDWQQVYAVNVLGAVYAIKHAVKYMKEQKSGAIVNTASIAGIRAIGSPMAYSASKAAVINLTMKAAAELGQYNIRANAVGPGMIRTGMTRWMWQYAKEQGTEERFTDCSKLLRGGEPEEVAQAILFFASDASSFVTGQFLAVDGGNSCCTHWGGDEPGWLKKKQ